MPKHGNATSLRRLGKAKPLGEAAFLFLLMLRGMNFLPLVRFITTRTVLVSMRHPVAITCLK